MLTDWITAIAASISCISLVLIIWQVHVNHDANRRSRTIDLIKHWDGCVTPDLFRVLTFVFSLPADAVQSIYAGNSFKVMPHLVTNAFPEKARDLKGRTTVEISVEESVHYRYTILHLLNTIEQIAIAYRHRVADLDMLNDAFYNMFVTNRLISRCESFMGHFGNSWPTISELRARMQPPRPLRAYPTSIWRRS